MEVQQAVLLNVGFRLCISSQEDQAVAVEEIVRQIASPVSLAERNMPARTEGAARLGGFESE
jgi:hypothetical protein